MRNFFEKAKWNEPVPDRKTNPDEFEAAFKEFETENHYENITTDGYFIPYQRQEAWGGPFDAPVKRAESDQDTDRQSEPGLQDTPIKAEGSQGLDEQLLEEDVPTNTLKAELNARLDKKISSLEVIQYFRRVKIMQVCFFYTFQVKNENKRRLEE